ncbi:hypothetical protein UWK_00737 [Desulfocapsa sulfexigens DSM 10523]|uniref:Uncharacterized protein n=1 Tax=Desulfocapsa sulfexigens (strain DSM 10523 / SB164P1) TaxID=1167006 RepID=M1PC32_DESSD|nr:hypothetical protein [Desulfocapsa sulfexigens]AGF77315.1 hypothetical protein UWK_00737 [Desulfocapsa sulfexigens DSM 10523]
MNSFVFLLLALFLQSCTHLVFLDPKIDRLTLLDEYQAGQEFGKALSLIADTPEEYPHALEIEKRRRLILDELRAYEKSVISTALKQERKNEWPAAKLTYSQALQKSGESKTLESAQQNMLLRFQKKLDNLEYEELIITGEWLQKKLPLLEDLHASSPNDLVVQWKYSRTKNDAREIALQLLHLGEQMLAENNLAMARRIVPLVVELYPGPEADSQMDRLDKQIRKRAIEKQKDRKKVAIRKDKKSMESFNKAMAFGKLAEARQHLSRLTAGAQKTVAVELMQERLHREISEYVEEELSVGDSFYRAGDYEQAIRAWENIIALEPENETVKSKLKRAETIVEKLHSLRKRQIEGAGGEKNSSM